MTGSRKTEDKKTLKQIYTELVASERKAEDAVSSVTVSSEEQKFSGTLFPKTKEIIFAGGCFWGMQTLFKKIPGVLKTEVGYTGGHSEQPTYDEVCSEKTGHFEAVRVTYDPLKLTFTELALRFFEMHDYTQTNGQGVDIGTRYMSRIFYQTSQEKDIAEKLIQALPSKEIKSNGMIETRLPATKLLSASHFWRAEEYHQDYHAKNHVPDDEICHVRKKLF